jgi:uncharacterized protein (TIGR02117 family)
MNCFPAIHRAVVIVWFCAIAACAGQTHTEDDWRCSAQHASCATVFVVYDSWHAALILAKAELPDAVIPETADFPNARYIEFSWGDQDYFPDPNSGVLSALRAAFWSSGSVLHLVGFADEVRRFYPKAEVVELRLAAPAFDRLVAFLNASFARPVSGKRSPPRPGLYDYSRFYPSSREFSLLNTCNTWVARALQTAGLPVTPAGVITAGKLGDQLEKIAPLPDSPS